MHGFLSWRRKKVGIVRDLFSIRGIFTSVCHNADKAEKISDDCMENEKSLLDTRRPLRIFFSDNSTLWIVQRLIKFKWIILLFARASRSLILTRSDLRFP